MKIQIKNVAAVSMLMFVLCTNVDFNNELDINGNSFLNTDENNNGIPDYKEDDDNDGIPDGYEDDDGDGIINKYDTDPIDTIPPEFNMEGNDTISIQLGPDFEPKLQEVKNSVTASDNEDGIVTEYIIITDSVSRQTPGVYPVIFSVTDISNNEATITRWIKVHKQEEPDTIAPVISSGPDTVYLQVGDSFVDHDVSAFDNKEGFVQVSKKGYVDTSRAGIYQITYTAKDKAGNVAIKIKTVIVKSVSQPTDSLPQITLTGERTIVITAKSQYNEPGYSARDAEDGDLTSQVVVNDSLFKRASEPGTYTITYTVKDKANHSVTERRTIKWMTVFSDTTKPVLTVEGGKTVFTIWVGNSWNALKPKVTAFDNKDGDLTNRIIVQGNVDTSKAGKYDITYHVTDSAKNSTFLVLTVNVLEEEKDTTKPVIILNGRNPDTVYASKSDTYKDPGATAIDNRDTLVCKASGIVDRRKPGTYTMTYSATDTFNNTGNETRTVVVIVKTGDLLFKYDVPGSSPLPSVDMSYYSYATEGTGFTTIAGFTMMQFKWSSYPQNQMNAFSIATGDVYPYYYDLIANGVVSINLGNQNPSITISGANSVFNGLDNEYYVTLHGEDLVWVKKDGTFAIIWFASDP